MNAFGVVAGPVREMVLITLPPLPSTGQKEEFLAGITGGAEAVRGVISILFLVFVFFGFVRMMVLSRKRSRHSLCRMKGTTQKCTTQHNTSSP